MEIDLTSKSLDRFPIYVRLGVPEILTYDSGELKIYHLWNGEYKEAEKSLVFANLPIKELPLVLEDIARMVN